MRRSRIGTLALAIGLIGGSVLAAEPQVSQELDQAVLTELRAEAFTLTAIDLPPAPGQPFFTAVELEGQLYTLDLRPHSNRASNFRVLVEQPGGMLEEVPAPPLSTYRGSVIELPGSQVSASIVNGGLRALINIDDAHTFSLQPLAEIVEGAPAEFHVVIDVTDGTPGDWICGNEIVPGFDRGPVEHEHAHADEVSDPGAPGTDDTVVAELAYDADFEFFNRNQGSIDNTIADIESVTNSMNDIYTRDVEIHHEITTIIVRTLEPDPYTTTSAGGLLDQLQDHWNRNQSGIQRDVAHLMTGKNLQGGTIGIAYLGVICNRSSAYGLSESKFTSRFDWRVALTAHEIGHNWNSPHCSNSCSFNSSCHIMCPCIGGCSGNMTRFGTSTISRISSFRNSRGCLDPFNSFQIEASTLFGGQNANFWVTGATPNEEIRAYYSLRGTGSCSVPDFNVVLDLDRCVLGLTGQTDANGEEQWTTRIPNVNRLLLIWIQAAQPNNVSDLLVTQINP